MEPLRALLTVFFGALAGGVTNRVAIWMLFHPRQPPRVLGHEVAWFEGAIPKNRERLARSVGEAVGHQLLTPDDLAEAFREEDLESAFRERLRELVERLLEEEHPSPRELLPDDSLPGVEKLLVDLVLEARPRLAAVLESPEFHERADRFLERLADAMERHDAGAPLDPDRAEALRGRAEGWLADLVESEAFEGAVDSQLRHAAQSTLRPHRTLEEMVPQGAVSVLEAAVSDYLPLAMERLGRLLEDADARGRFEQAVHDLLDRFMEDLRFHQRVVAKLIITEETVENVLRTLEEEGAQRLGEVLRETEVQAAMARSVNDALQDLLRRPVTDVVGEPGDERVERFLESVGGWTVRTARDPRTRRALLDRLESAVLEKAELDWAELVRRLPPDRVGGWAADALRSEAGREAVAALADEAVRGFLDRPLGAPGRVLGEDAARRVVDLLEPPIWRWITRELPDAAAALDVAGKVEEKLLEYPLEDLERLVRSVTQRELDLIVRLGYVLGGTIGLILVGVDALMRLLG